MSAGSEAYEYYGMDVWHTSVADAFITGYDLALEQISQHIDQHKDFVVLPDGRVIADIDAAYHGTARLVVYEDYQSYRNAVEGE